MATTAPVVYINKSSTYQTGEGGREEDRQCREARDPDEAYTWPEGS